MDKALKWTTEKPTKAGYYWMKSGSSENPKNPNPLVVPVKFEDDPIYGQIWSFLDIENECKWISFEDVGDEISWAGPIQPPQE